MDQLGALISRAKAGDTQAFEEIVVSYQDMAVGYAYSILKDFHAAQDAAQEAFIRAYLSLGQLREPAAFSSWLRRIIFSSCTRMTRKKSAATTALTDLDSAQPELDPPVQQERRWAQEQLRQAVDALSEEQRAVFVLYHIHNLSYRQISSFLGLAETTVNNRLHGARSKLRKELLSMVERNMGSSRASGSEKFKRKVIEGIAKIGFDPQPNRGPENIPLPSVMRVCLRALGEDYGSTPYAGMRLDNAYIHFMGVTGAAFRSFWNWDSRLGSGGRTEAVYLPMDGERPYRRALEAAGYTGQILLYDRLAGSCNTGMFPNEAELGSLITKSIDKGYPVIGIGVVGPTEHCLITGYDDEGDLLIGWSYFQDDTEGVEPSGYFRKRYWYPETTGVILLGEKRTKCPQREVYSHAMADGLQLMRCPEIRGVPIGLASHAAWAEALLCDDNFPTDDPALLTERLMVHEVTILELAERRWYGARFLEQASAVIPSMADVINHAAACFDAVHGIAFNQLLALTGDHRQPDAPQKLADPTNRHQMAEFIDQIRAKDEEAVAHLERVVEALADN